MNNKIINNNFGISILEVIVAILIITIGMVGVLSLVIQNIQAQHINKNVLIASGLAQEGLELVRNVRDLNWLTSGNSWKLGAGIGTDSNIVQDGNYAIDYNGKIIDVDSISDARLYIDKVCVGGSNEGANCAQNSDCDSNVCQPNGFYTHASSGNTPTNFYRLITVDDRGDYLDIKCAIRWQEGTQNRDYTAETYLYNWR